MSSIKMDELLVSWLGSDDVYENVMELIEQYRQAAAAQHYQDTVVEQLKQNKRKLLQKQRQQREEQEEDEEEDDDHDDEDVEEDEEEGGEETTKKMAANDENKKQHMNIHKFDSSSSDVDSQSSPRGVAVSSSSIPPFYPHAKSSSYFNERRRRRRTPLTQYDTWDPLPDAAGGAASTTASAAAAATSSADTRTTSPNDVVGGGIPPSISSTLSDSSLHNNNQQQQQPPPNMALSVRDQVRAIFAEFGQDAATAAAAGPDDGSTSSPNMAAASSSSSSDSDSVHSGKGGTGRGVAARSATTMTKNQKENEDENLDDNNGMENDKKIASVPSAATTASIIESPGARPASIPPDDADPLAKKSIPPHAFGRITKDICRFPSFFCHPLYQRILDLWNMEKQNQQTQQAQAERQQQQEELGEQPSLSSLGGDEDDEFQQQQPPAAVQVETVVTLEMMEWFWKTEMEPHDPCDRFYRLVKQPHLDYICRDDFLPFIKALLQDHPGLEFLASHSEFQEKYAVTVITRIFYCVNKCHSGRITSRQVRRSDLCAAFHQVDEEEDINKVTRYFSYEHFYVLYCRFWELDHDRDYRITREDLLKYGDHSLSHMIVDRIFDAAPRPFEQERPNRDFLSYEDFIYFMLSEEDKSNEVAVRYWFTCVDVDGDGKLNNMEMRSFYAVQLHRMQCMGHEIVPFEDMLCQMMDMIKPKNADFLIAQDFLQPECCQVSGALFDALFNLNKYLLFEQRDPFVERQKREDEFECDWDRFACMDYNRLAMEEEAREEEAMEIDWVTVDEEEDDAVAAAVSAAAAQAGIDADYQYQGGNGGGGGSIVTHRQGNAPF